MKPAERYRLSVTALADFACKGGNLEFGGVVGPSAREGIRAHQKLQARELENSSTIESEVTVKILRLLEGAEFQLTGRLDLLDKGARTLCEIKTTLVPSDKLPDYQVDQHWAQAMLYGYCAFGVDAADGNLAAANSVQLQLVYVNIRASTETRLRRDVTLDELREFIDQALSRYLIWIRLVRKARASLDKTADLLNFPHTSFRSGQRDMAAAVYRCARDREILMCEAPTGIGKTISCLFPAIKSMGEHLIDHVVYLTAKSSGVSIAFQSVQHMREQGLAVTAIVLRSKQLTCFCSTGRCVRDENGVCPVTIGFFDRLPEAREALLERAIIDGDTLDEVAWEYQLCPFELALQMLPWVAVVVCDYNYVYDPLVRLGRFNEPRGDTLVLVDEAHNLLDRSRSMFSAELSRSEINHWAQQEKSHPGLVRRATAVADALLKQARDMQTDLDINATVPKLPGLAAAHFVDAYMEAMTGPAVSESMFELFKACCRYLAIQELFGDAHRVITRAQTQGRRKQVSIELLCLDASEQLNGLYRQFRASVFFSATLRPENFYQRSLGLGPDARFQKLPSPFSSSQSLQAIVSHINTRYRQRRSSLPELLDLIRTTVLAKSGNYIVFFPSYAYLQQAYDAYCLKFSSHNVWLQTVEDSREDRQQIIDRMDEPGDRLGFAIMGGVFGEGVDYVGDRLIGVIVVGVGLPGQTIEQDLIADHYRSEGYDGYDYAYRYPGFTRVLQTVGRLIRDEKDRGVVLLVDDRFNTNTYRSLFPEHWRLESIKSGAEATAKISSFWSADSCA
ncbi:MAG: ATP-dependent DNA helicase [bacterium]